MFSGIIAGLVFGFSALWWAPPWAWILLMALGCAPFLFPGHPRAVWEPSLAFVAAAAAQQFLGLAGLSAFGVLGVWMAGRQALRRLGPLQERHLAFLDGLPPARVGWSVALAAAAGLFAELMLLRWHASSSQLFSYFKNVTLLAAFLGLGIGYASGQGRALTTILAIPAMCFQMLLLLGLRFSVVKDLLQNPVTEHLTLGLQRARTWAQISASGSFLLLMFVLTVLTCIPFGQLASRLMGRLPPLKAYGWNLVGSLAGVLLFSAMSFAWAPPVLWLAMLTLMLASLLRPVALLVPSLIAVALTVGAMSLTARRDQVEIYSPYQHLVLRQAPDTLPWLEISHVYYQRILDLRPETVRSQPHLRRPAEYYDMPYRFAPGPERVLVVGSGTGNDVAAALRHGAGHVDAVEIDPAILQVGRSLHPERPYADDRVEVFVDDARNFIRKTERRYDLIVFGLLDSHTLLSGHSNVRLDGFVYTVESFREARTRLRENGMIVLTFSVLSPEIGRKLLLMLREAFDGLEPVAIEIGYDMGVMFLTLPRSSRIPLEAAGAEVTDRYHDPSIKADPATDDWPFLYMPVRTYPVTYAVLVAALILVSALLVKQFLPARGFPLSPVPFLLGAGFMLIETKGITELALTFGSTWQVASAVISGVLVMAFLANLVTAWTRSPRLWPAYLLLFATLAAGAFLPRSALAGLPVHGERAITAVLITLPLLFSGFAFSGAIRQGRDLGLTMSSNLLGAMLGGFLEYNSMYFGFRSLYGAAALLYALAFLLSRRTASA